MSLTISGAWVIFLTWLFGQFGINASGEAIANFVEVGGLLLGLVMVAIGRWRVGGVRWWGWRT